MQKQYDNTIKEATRLHLNGVDWRLLKAQLCQESALNPSALSPMGAMGIAQFMPKTWRDMQKQLQMHADTTPYDAHYAIHAAAHYMAKLCKGWSAKRQEADRYMLALASYNAGFGNILKAQKLANNAAEYYPIISKLDQITGPTNALETTHYVKNIFKIFGEYIMQGR